MSQIKIIVLSLFGLLVTVTANAATITVTASNGLVANNAECSIIEAIINANNNAQTHSDCTAGNGADTINLTQDITLITAYENHISYGRTGTPSIDTKITLDGHGFALQRAMNLSCALNGNWENDFFRLLRTTQNAELTLQNITIANGCADGSSNESTSVLNGGGLYNEAARLNIINVTFKQNKAFKSGGGIYHIGGTLELINNSTFKQNKARKKGGGLYHASGTLELINNSTFVDNEITSSIIAGRGGGIANRSLISTIQNSTFSGNSAFYGGGIDNNFATINNISNSTFSENTDGGFGGFGAAIHNDSATINNILNSTFSENSRESSAFAIDNESGSTINLILNCTFSENDNVISNSGTITAMNNSLFHDNIGFECVGLDSFNGTNNISDNTLNSCPGMLDILLTSNSIAPLADNGGPTMTHALLAGSEAVDAADNTATSNDQRGFPANGIRDIGAFEKRLEDFCSAALQIDGFTTAVSTSDELNQVIYCSNLNGPLRDTINLTQDIIFTEASNNSSVYSRTGAPPIDKMMTLDGHGFAIERDISLECNLINHADVASEFRLLRTTPGADLILKNITITNGCANDTLSGYKASGGGLYNEGDLSLIDVVFKQNYAYYRGGGVFHFGGTLTLVKNSLFVDNKATARGGAIAALQSPIGTIENSTFSGNSADFYGGAIYNSSDINAILNSTFSGNSASINGAAIHNTPDGTITALNNSLFHNNDSNTECRIFNIFNGSNNISDNPLSRCPGLISTSITPSTVAPLADNGGPTMTHALLVASEALNAADTVTNTGTATSYDQRGIAANGIRDIGAYEQRAEDICSIQFPDDSFTTSVGNSAELILAMECSNMNGQIRDTITLTQDIILTSVYEDVRFYGRTGTPPIETAMLLDGNGFTLLRDYSLDCDLNSTSAASEFRLLRSAQSADLILQNITLANGCADSPGFGTTSASGGGLFNEADSTIENVVFKQNQARVRGGSIIHASGVLGLISNSLFVDNYAGRGGAIAAVESTINSIENSTFSGNSVFFDGGAIYNYFSDINAILNSTFSGNSADSNGAAIYNTTGSTITALNNSLFHNNGNNSECRVFNIFNGSNNISDNPSSECPGVIATVLSTGSVSPLADNDGPTMTHALLLGSEAIDAADTVTNTGTATSADQRGAIAIGTRDIGAYEYSVFFNQCQLFMDDGFDTIVNDAAELIEAMKCSNLNGANRDNITLSQDITLTTEYEADGVFGRTGTPAIEKAMRLDGNGFTLMRDNSLNCDINGISTDSEFRLLFTTQGADLILQNIKLANGCVDGSDLQASGGGLYNEADLIIEEVVFKQNRARVRGGSIIHASGVLGLISNSLFVDNYAGRGGAIATYESPIDSIVNSTFSGNSADFDGGAIYNYFSDINTILNSTFSGNSAGNNGAAIYNTTDSTISALNNSLFHNNNSNTECRVFNIFNGSNNISDNPSSDCPGLIATILSTSSISSLADNGGLTMTHALLDGSQAIDIADTVTNTGTATSTDQRGFATDNIRDIGAYEVQVPVVTAPADIMLEATGATTAVSLGSATVVDIDEVGLSASADITGPFTVGVHTINWSATDSQGHVGSAIQTVTITDNTAPTITLNDSESIQIVIGGSYTAGAIASDLVDGDLTASIITGGNSVDVNTAGIYVVTYSVTDQANNTAQTVQTVNVQASVQVTVSGLHANGFVDLTSNGQILMFTNNGTSSFGPFDNGTVYAVDIVLQPTSPNQTCVITGGSNNDGSGVIAGNNVELTVTCTTNVYFIGGLATGLIPDSNLVLQNNLGDDLLITDDGAFVFATALEDLQSYDITVFLQPDDPIQNCILSNVVGNIAGADVIDVSINCDVDLIFRNGFEDSPAITVFDSELVNSNSDI